jgi:oligopeptide transport system substrate-binding protein
MIRRQAILCALLALAASACSGHRDRPIPGTLRFNLANEPPSLDWSITTDNASIRVLTNLMEGLTRFDEKLRPVPGLAQSWEVLDEGRRYLFHLNPKARWTDGKPVVAEEFVYSWRRLLDPKNAAEYAYFIYMVKNAEAINSGKMDPKELGIRALDDRTLEVELSTPMVFFPMITTFMVTYPMRRDVVEKFGDNWTEPGNIVTCGPYRMTEWEHEYKLVLERNPLYHGERPGLDRIVFYMVQELSTALSLYQTGGIDALDPMPPPSIPSYEGNPEYVNFPYFATYYYGFNTSKPPMDNPKVRAALASAIDRRELPKILKGHQIPVTTLIPFGMEGYRPELGYDFNPERARRLLAEAGYPGGKGMQPIEIGYNTEESHRMIAEFVQQEWRRNLGITVELRNMEWKVYLKELQNDPPHVWRLGWIMDYPDPDSMMTVFLGNSGNNHTRWKSKEYDDLVLRAQVERDPAARRALYDRAQSLLCREVTAIVPLYSYTINSLVKPWVRDYPENGLDLLDFRRTRIVEKP